MSYVDRPRDDDAALNIDDQRCADYLTVTTLKVIVIVEPYRLRLVALMTEELEKKRGGEEKIYTGKVTALSANYRESRLK